MKVTEKATDRKAEVHIYVEGKVQALPEYGEYIDPRDKAICCYVPVDEGHKIKIGGKFSGTTLTIAYDAVVDGVYRKASSYSAKTVHDQKNKKINAETFLFKSDKGIIDTDMLVGPLVGVTASQGEEAETIGTMELRLSITRQFGVVHTIGNVERWSNPKGNTEDETKETVSYKRIAPTFQMELERNSPLLDNLKVARELRRINTTRPGTEPWAIFRFHYRSKDAITAENLKLTFDPRSKAKTEPHTLLLEPVPPLPIGIKPQKDDRDSSTRASSPMPPDVPSTPVKGVQTASAPKSPKSTKKQQPRPTTTMTSNTEKEPTTSPESSPRPEALENLNEGLRTRVFSKSVANPPAKETPTAAMAKAANNGDTDNVMSSANVNGDSYEVAETSRDTTATTGKLNGPEAANAATNKPADKPVEKEQTTTNDTIAVVIPKGTVLGSVDDSAAMAPSLADTNAQLTNGTTMRISTQANEIAKKAPQTPLAPAKKPVVKPAPINTTTPTIQKQSHTPTAPATATKRPSALTSGKSPELKRAKIAIAPTAPSIPTIVPQITLGSPTLKLISIERQVPEQRKRLEALRKKRLEMAKKQMTIDIQMEPYKQRMAEELERLKAEMREEETAYTEEEQHYSASVEMLTEFKKVDGGN